MLVTAGQRIFFDTALKAPEVYVEISRPEASDLNSEIEECHFLDGAKSVIDWSQSLPNLKRLAQERVYTARMTQKALHRLVSRFTPEHAHLVSDLTANEMANYLLRTETNRDKTVYRRKELFELTRKPEMELRAPLTTARKLIDLVYPADRPGTEMQRSSAWRMAIISFLPDELAIPISERLRISNEMCQPITDEVLEAMAYQAEEAYRKPPPCPLKFGRTIGSMPVSAMIQFNSMLADKQQAIIYEQAVATQQDQQTTEPHSVDPWLSQNDRYTQIEHQIECLALTVKEGMAAVKTLSRRGAPLASSQPRAKTPSTEAQRPKSRSQSREPYRQRTKWRDKGKRDQSKSPGRQTGLQSSAPDRRSRKDDHSAQRGRDRSFAARQTYPKMMKGDNCSLDYDPMKSKTCTKCSKPGHHEFECNKYNRYCSSKCNVCDGLNHFAADCKELEKFPPHGREFNSIEAGKNW